MPLSAHDWLVVVAPTNSDDTAPDLAGMRVFHAGGDQGVTYAPDLWHHPLLVLQPVQEFLVIDRASPPAEDASANLTEYWFDGVAAVIAPLTG